MSDLLAAVRAEMDELETKLATLRDMERLALQLAGDVPMRKRNRSKQPAAPRNGVVNGSAVSGVHLKRRIKEMLTREGMTELRLVEATGADREEVADQCGRLLLDDEIVLDPDGTYRTAQVAA
jgi:hypothetical protein